MSRKQPESVAARRPKGPAATKPEIGKADVAMPEPTRPPAGAAPAQIISRPDPETPPRGSDDTAEIAARAHAKWQARGCPIGDDKRDWFDAQEELRRERMG
jgi:hypothetical protein